MSSVPSVDVVIVSYNARDHLAACLASLREHGTQRRVHVFDNASSDGSAELVVSRFPEVDLVRSPHNLGFARANNELVAAVDADHVLLLNPDTVLTEDIVAPLLWALESDPRIAVAGPRLVYPDGRPQPSSERLPDLRYELACSLHGTKADPLLRPLIDLPATIAATREVHLREARESRAVELLWATCWLMRTGDARRYGPFDERFSTYDEDVDTCRRLVDDGRLVQLVPSVSLVHAGGASSDPTRKRRLMRAGRARYYRVHGGRPRELAYRAIVTGADAARSINPARLRRG
jgi:N-acetylglucosaminyl-diphospho-decaprenol L-rhamnosyltransferase